LRASNGVLCAALLAAASLISACSNGGDSPGGTGGSTATGGNASGGRPASGGQPGSGGSTGTGGSSGQPGSGGSANTGGSSSSSGGSSGDASAPETSDTSGSEAGGDTPSAAGNGTALMVVGPQIIGTDKDIIAALEAKGLKVETVVDSAATVAHTEGKSLVVLSYSLDSDNFKADYSNIKAPIILMELGLLARLGMTSAGDNKWIDPVTALTIVAADSPLAAGLPAGDHVVFAKPGKFFWGTPSASAIKVATVKGAPTHWVIFAYPAGAMMVGKQAAGKRLHFFFGAHLIPDVFFNDTGKKLLGAAIEWSIK
jgi:hypothetical protein